MYDQDRAVIQRILGGDKKAYAELVERHKDKAMTLALKMLKNRQDAEEALQDAFVRVFKALSQFEGKSSFSTWFYRIVYNVCASELGRRSDEQQVSLQEEDDDGRTVQIVSDEIPPDLALESSEFNAIILEEIDRLPDAYGPTFALFFVQDMSYDEIVEVTGLPLGTVKAKLFRARILLRDAVVKRIGNVDGSKQEKVVLLPTRDSLTDNKHRARRNGTLPY
jgi:RNA polymerase sigma-70 factor, ECF subfamily